jgi:hypothetical protein
MPSTRTLVIRSTRNQLGNTSLPLCFFTALASALSSSMVHLRLRAVVSLTPCFVFRLRCCCCCRHRQPNLSCNHPRRTSSLALLM